MRCNSKCEGFFEIPKELKEIPKCVKCGELMRCHCLFFDECYNEKQY